MNKKTKLLLGTLFLTTTIGVTAGVLSSCANSSNGPIVDNNSNEKVFDKNYDFCKVFSGTEFDDANFVLNTLQNQISSQQTNKIDPNFLSLLKLLNFSTNDSIQLKNNFEQLKDKIVFYLKISGIVFKIILNNIHNQHNNVVIDKIKPNHLFDTNLTNQINEVYDFNFNQYKPNKIINNFKPAPVIVDNDIYNLNTPEFFEGLNETFLSKFPALNSSLTNEQVKTTNINNLKLDLQFYLQNKLKKFITENNLVFKTSYLFLNINDIFFDINTNSFNFNIYFQYQNNTSNNVEIKTKTNNIVVQPNQYISVVFNANKSIINKTITQYENQNYLSYDLNNISFKYEINDSNNIISRNNLNLNLEKSISINSYLQNSVNNKNNYYSDIAEFETNFSQVNAEFFESDLTQQIDKEYKDTKIYIINAVKILEKINNKTLTINNVLNLISPEIYEIVLTKTNDIHLSNIIRHLMLNEKISTFLFNTYKDIFAILSNKINNPEFNKILEIVYNGLQNCTEQDLANMITSISGFKSIIELLLQNLKISQTQIESILKLVDKLSLNQPILDFCIENENEILSLISFFVVDQNTKQILNYVINFFVEIKKNTGVSNPLTLNFWDTMLNNLNTKQPLITLLTNLNTIWKNQALTTIIDLMSASYPNMTVDNVLLTITNLLNPTYIDVNKKPIKNLNLTLVQYFEQHLILQKTIVQPIVYQNNKLGGQIDYKYVLSDVGLKFNMKNFKKLFKNTTATVPIDLPLIGRPNLETAINFAVPNDLYILANTDFKYSYNLSNSNIYPNVKNNNLSYKIILEKTSDFSGLKPSVDYLGFLKAPIWTVILNEIFGHDYTVPQKNAFLYESNKIINSNINYDNYNLDVANLKYFVVNGENNYFINTDEQTNPDLYQEQLLKQQEWDAKKNELLTLLNSTTKNDAQIKDTIIQLFLSNSLNNNSDFLLPSIWYYPNKDTNSTKKYCIDIYFAQKVLYKSKTLVDNVSNYILEFKNMFSFQI